ncbi:MAG: type 4a pilus biogenesis protein PilO [Nitrospirae bacterium]|nr:type 4a pilus biogenesis protein PilO [Nitrospirota bacterium]MBI3352363.1 type 4a pilus biogenesis protein PilO [Nitrospirota bacterium]
MTFLEKINQFLGLKRFPVLYQTLKDPIYAGILLTLIITLIGGLFYGPKKREVTRLNEERNLTQSQTVQKEKNLSLLKEQVNRINLRLQRRSLNIDHLTANERKMSQVLEKMALLAAGDSVEVISFRPDSRQEEEKEVLLTVRVKVKTRFNELERYLSKLDHFPQPVKIDRIKIETLEDETPLIFAELLVTTRLKKEEG